MKKNLKTFFVAYALIISLMSGATLAADRVPFNGEYNHGPDPKTRMGRWLMDLQAALPEYFALSDELMERQKFRYTFGTMMTRAFVEPNRTKVLFVGQDATGIAELSKIPGVSGFGGQVQGLASHFGVDQGVATTNAYLSTISGQYGAFGHVYVENEGGKPVIRQSKYIDNELWAATHHPASEIRITREMYWEWMLLNNSESMDMMVFFGDAAKDSFAQFLIGRGYNVPVKISTDKLKTIQVPETILVNSGGNGEFPVPVNKKGQDIFEILLEEKFGRVPPYFKKNRRTGKMEISYATDMKTGKSVTQIEALKALQEAGQRGVDMMVFTGGGIHGSGVTDIAQLFEYDFDNVTNPEGKKVRDLLGMDLKFFKGQKVTRRVAFIESPHPTVLSKIKDPKKKADTVKRAFKPLEELKKEYGWKVTPDVDANGRPYANNWDEGKDYVHRKKEIGTAYLEQGAPANRRTSSADFVRDGKQMIIGNTRLKAGFDESQETAALKSQPASPKNPNDIWSARPRDGVLRYIYDDGPGDDISRLMADNLDLNVLLAPKKGMDEGSVKATFDAHGIDAYNVKSHPGAEYYGTHRGDFKKSRALILADPHGIDEWTTSRAMTGGRGQYLHGMMEELGFGEEYLVVRTAPFGMDGATDEEWEFVRRNTEKYREALIAEALKNKIEIIVVDGPIAKKEMQRILKAKKVTGIAVVEVERGAGGYADGILDAGKKAAKSLGISATKITGRHADIPTSHLTYRSRIWEGTGGVDLTIDATDKLRGMAHKVITPDWVARQDVKLLDRTQKSIDRIRDYLKKMNIRIGKEKLTEFLADHSGSWSEIEANRQSFFAGKRTMIPVLSAEKCRELLMKSTTAKNRLIPGAGQTAEMLVAR